MRFPSLVSAEEVLNFGSGAGTVGARGQPVDFGKFGGLPRPRLTKLPSFRLTGLISAEEILEIGSLPGPHLVGLVFFPFSSI